MRRNKTDREWRTMRINKTDREFLYRSSTWNKLDIANQLRWLFYWHKGSDREINTGVQTRAK